MHLYKYNFIFFLKEPNVGKSLRYKGKLFQSLGATTENARSPLSFNLVLGTSKSSGLATLDSFEVCVHVKDQLNKRVPDCVRLYIQRYIV